MEAYRSIELRGEPERTVTALTYLADPTHKQYAGTLDLDSQFRIVRTCCGQAGANIEYVLNTVAHLEELGVYDPVLHVLAERLRREAGDASAD